MAEPRGDGPSQGLPLVEEYARPAEADRSGKQNANDDWMAQQVTRYGDGWRTGFSEGIAMAWEYLTKKGQGEHAEALARRAVQRFGETAERELQKRGRR